MTMAGKSPMKLDAAVENLPYYHYCAPKVFIESLLKKNGDFLLHREWNANSYTVSVRWGAKVKECPVVETCDGEFFLDFPEETQYFAKISDLIAHYVDSGEKVTKSGAVLIEAIPFKPWEVIGRACEESLEKSELLGKGDFASVVRISFRRAGTDNFQIVAAKMVTGWSNLGPAHKPVCRKILFQEAKSMSDLNGHVNIVPFRGIFVDTDRPAILLGVVKGVNYLKDLRTSKSNGFRCMRTLILGAIDAASAVAYMHEKGYIHRSLGARKFMVQYPEGRGERSRLVLVGFRTAKYVGKEIVCRSYSCSPCIPMRWSAPEVLMKSIFLRQSDVWSLAVLMWEILTQGESPYTNATDVSRAAFMEYLKRGNRLEVPRDVHKRVTEMMHSCWNMDVFQRPSAASIVKVLNEIVVDVNACTNLFVIMPEPDGPMLPFCF